MITSAPAYPAAERHSCSFGIKFIKAVMASDAIVLHGVEVVTFAAWIASLEDRLKYQKPPMLWRADIEAKFGFHRNEATSRLLKNVVDSGLVYRVPLPVGSREQMTFWTTVPEWLKPYFQPQSGSENGTSGRSTGSGSGTSGGTRNGTRNGTLSTTCLPIDLRRENRPELRPFRRDGAS